MIRHIHIQNFAIVEHLELDLSDGMTVLTGETGAGKSILFDALGLALGDRADNSIIRHGCERAEIGVEFDITGREDALRWLAEQALDAEDACLLRRTLSMDGRSRGFINGRPVPMQSLRELGEMLVDIHGQHEHQSLLRREMQRQTLDHYAGHDGLLAQVRLAQQRWRRLRDELAELSQAAADREAHLELLRYQVSELELLALADDEVGQLDEEHARLANVSRLQEGAQRTLALLYEGEHSTVHGQLSHCVSELQELRGYDPALSSISLLGPSAGS